MKNTFCFVLLIFTVSSALWADTNDTFTVATYNVENWNEIERHGKPNEPKPSWERAAVVNIMTNFHLDVVALEEIGTTNDLAELHDRLRAKGMTYPYRQWLQASDPDRHLALLSRFPLVANHSRTNDTYRLDSQREFVQRGILDVTVQVHSNYSFRIIAVHLKSKRSTDIGDQAKMRFEEARLLRKHLARILRQDPNANFIVLGDFNDTPDSQPIRSLRDDATLHLFVLPSQDSTGGTATHLWKLRNEYSRLDYLMASPGMSNEYITGSAHVADYPGWNTASDHRAVFGRFHNHDIGPAPLPKTNTPSRF